ncbi:MAG: lipopolysaccharide kinase InaA family protein [Candidatus Brocadiia bacterium]
MRWRTVAEFAETIPRLDLERLRSPRELPPDELVKDSTTRTVARLDDPLQPDGPGLYVKRYKFRDLTDRLRYLLVPTKAEQEWRISRGLQAAGIPTCDVLAIAERRRALLPREGFLVSREIADTHGLAELAGEENDAGFRAELLEELAALTAALANGGFHHRDYHAGNLPVRAGARAGRRVFVTDLHAIRQRRVGRRRMTHMLAMLWPTVEQLSATERDERRFLRRLLESWRGGPGAADEAVRRLAQRVRRRRERLHRRHVRSRTKRCLKESSLFTRDVTEDFVMHRRRDFPVEAALSAVRAHERAAEGSSEGGEIRQRSRRTVVSVCPCSVVPPRTQGQPARPEELTPGQVCVKAFLRPSTWDRIKDAMRPRGRARAAWVAARGMQVRGIPAAQPIALLESRRKLSGGADYLITEAVEHDDALYGALREGDLSPTDRQRLAEAMADLLRRMAEEGAYHPDTKPGNILVRREGDGYSLWLVDLDRTSFPRRLSRARWVKTLARINAQVPAEFSLLERMRFLRRCGRGRWDAEERLEVAREVLQRSAERLGRAAASGAISADDSG